MNKWVVVVGTYAYKYVSGVHGPFDTEEQATKYAESKNFGPMGRKIYQLINPYER